MYTHSSSSATEDGYKEQIQKFGKMDLGRASTVTDPVHLAERRLTLSSSSPSRTGLNGAPGGHTVSKR